MGTGLLEETDVSYLRKEEETVYLAVTVSSAKLLCPSDSSDSFDSFDSPHSSPKIPQGFLAPASKLA
jgi:hypothetical protein